MKKVTSDTLPFEDAATEYLIPSNRHSQEQPGPVSPVFTILPNVDTQSLLCHASETLASLNAALLASCKAHTAAWQWPCNN